jgi:molecular chaperone GrpE
MKKKNKQRATGSSEHQEHAGRDTGAPTSTGDDREEPGPEETAGAGRDEPREEGDAGADDRPEDEELARMQDRYLRLAAEYDNYRKRTERERSESWLRAQADLAGRLLDPLDDLSRVSGQDGAEAAASAVIEGVRLVERKLLRTLEEAGLEPVEAAGTPFDPEVHEALMTVPAEEPEEDDMVADVFQEGYRFKGVLLRPARVRVKKFEA